VSYAMNPWAPLCVMPSRGRNAEPEGTGTALRGVLPD
jgi:hypothetical protein